MAKETDKSEVNPEAKSEAKSEAKPEAKSEAKAEAKPEAKSEAKPEAKPPEIKYSMSAGLVNFFQGHDLSIALSSYQSGKFYLLGRNPKGGLMVNEHFFTKAMGICY